MPELYEFVKLHNTGAKLIMPVIICSLHFIAKTTTYILNIKFASFKTKIVQLRSKITVLSANMSNRSFKSCLVLEKNLLLVPGIFLEVTKTSIFGAWYIREPVRPNFQFFFVQTFFRLFISWQRDVAECLPLLVPEQCFSIGEVQLSMGHLNLSKKNHWERHTLSVWLRNQDDI